MFLHVVKAEYREGYNLRLTFNTGAVKDVDLESELHGDVFEPLRDPKVFEKVYVNPDTNTIEWENGADFAPEFLDEVGKAVEPATTRLSLQAVGSQS